ncbi:hypothetical protein PPTG_24900 [Phytophthora nicotianae INRA-310]|uniref:Uncharacterized protein n=1 Tax=Phytophthora nicotianae (strain INRA-310) TaxID=761204 RepID=W2P9S6_PHYN3|nr:hypothetical protein PPTG_24900 [Phytophthora nicotianae INRA-310]ETM97581.1 hypothetical protein PPTG_24900 [Phytophthora nicotianae INRA-310]
MPPFKTASFKKYLECLDYFWRHANFLREFCAEHPFLKRKCVRKRMARVAVDALAKHIVPVSGERVEAGASEAHDGGLHGRVQDEQALLALPPDAFVCSISRRHQAREAKEA